MTRLKDPEINKFIQRHAELNRAYLKRKWGNGSIPNKHSIAVIMATYQRSDKTTPQLIEKTLLTLKAQTYKNFKLFLIGDRYDNREEFESFVDHLEGVTTDLINLDHITERDFYSEGDPKLWNTGGVTALNKGIKLAIKDKYDFITFLDHDDLWEPYHLQNMADALSEDPRRALCATRGRHFNGALLPDKSMHPGGDDYFPKAGQVLKSAVCYNRRLIPISFDPNCEGPADANLWDKISEYMEENNLKGYLINKETVKHPDENNTKQK